MPLNLPKNTARWDPRLYQISVLTVLLVYGIFRLDFDVKIIQVFVVISAVTVTQYFCALLAKLPRFDIRSPLISGLSLCLLLRTNFLIIAALAAVVTIASKFIFRWKGKHFFNPTNFGLVVMLIFTETAWVSPGQWGSAAFFGFLLACIGGLVVNRAERSDVTYAFLASYILLLFGRALWLGDPVSIPLHQLQNGAFLIFAFFMISDPKTTPDSRAGRVLFAFLVAVGAVSIQYGLYRTNALLWSLAAFAFLVPVIDYFTPGIRYQWKHRDTNRASPLPIVDARTAVTGGTS